MQVWNVCTALAANTGRKKSSKDRHMGIIAQLCRSISLQLRHVSTIGKKILLSSNIASTRSHNMVNFGPLAAAWYTRPKMVTHPSTNQARRRVTSFMRRATAATMPCTPPCLVITADWHTCLHCTQTRRYWHTLDTRVSNHELLWSSAQLLVVTNTLLIAVHWHWACSVVWDSTPTLVYTSELLSSGNVIALQRPLPAYSLWIFS